MTKNCNYCNYNNCKFRDLRENLNSFSAVDRLSIVTSGGIGPLRLLIFARCKHSNQSIYYSRNDFLMTLIPLSLVWCQINPSFITKVRARLWRSQLCLHFWLTPGYVACRKMSPMCVTLKARLNQLTTGTEFGARCARKRNSCVRVTTIGDWVEPAVKLGNSGGVLVHGQILLKLYEGK